MLEQVTKAVSDMAEKHKTEMEAQTAQILELRSRVNSAEQELVARVSGSRADANPAGNVQLKLREAFAAKAEQLKELKKNPKMAVMIETDLSVKEFMGVTPGNSPDSSWPTLPERRPGIIDLVQPITVLDALPSTPIGTNVYEFVQYQASLSTNAAAPVDEGAAKPQSQYQFELKQTSPIVLAHIAKFSQQLIDDTVVLSSFAPGKMRQQIALLSDAQILNGSGSGTNLDGLFTQATVGGVGGYTIANDKVGYAVAAMRAAGYSPSFIVANPLDVLAVRAVKDTTGQPLQYNQFFGGLPIIESPNVVSGHVLIVDGRGVSVLNRTGVTFLLGYDGTDFSHNLITARCEVRLGLAVYDTGAIVKIAI